MKNVIISLFAFVTAMVVAGTSPGQFTIYNGKGGTGAFILRDSIWTNTAAGVYAKVGVTDTSKLLRLNSSTMFHTYQWRIGFGTDSGIVDSLQYSEGILCSLSAIGAWVPGANIMSNTNNIRIDTTVNCTYGPNGYGSYEAYFSRCDAIKFILRVNAATHNTDTVKILSRGLKVE